jgi:hypothetical protein
MRELKLERAGERWERPIFSSGLWWTDDDDDVNDDLLSAVFL